MSAENHDIATASLGIELGSTRIKACLVDADVATIAAGLATSGRTSSSTGCWTYSLDAVRDGLQAAYADLVAAARRRRPAVDRARSASRR